MISLRRARLDDYWRRAFKRDYQTSIVSIEFTDGIIFDGLAVTLPPGINALVGRNGIGKSNLLRGLYNSFVTEKSNQSALKHLLNLGDLSVRLNHNGSEKNIRCKSLPSETDNKDICGLMFDPCMLIPSLQKLFTDQTNLDELLEGHSKYALNEDELVVLNYLLNATYKSVDIINIEDEFEDFPVIPFFYANTGKIQYDLRGMGLGELSLFYFYWLISYMGKIGEDSILFIEEPESFLPPSAQEKLSDILIMTAANNGVSVFLSTHSEHILKRIPRTHIQLMISTPQGVDCLTASDDIEPLKLLGLSSPKEGLILCEDSIAEIFVRSILKSSNRFVPDSFFFHKSGSYNQILSTLNELPKNFDDFGIIGFFDGDIEASQSQENFDDMFHCFLPSKTAPEKVLIQYINEKDEQELASKLGISNVQLIGAKEASAGSDHHDYFYRFSQYLGLDFKATVSHVCDCWVTDINNNDYIKETHILLESFYS